MNCAFPILRYTLRCVAGPKSCAGLRGEFGRMPSESRIELHLQMIWDAADSPCVELALLPWSGCLYILLVKFASIGDGYSTDIIYSNG